MDNQPHSPRPKPKAIPLLNGSSPLHATQESRDANERNNAFAAIKSSMGPRKIPIDLEDGHYFQPQQSVPKDKRPARLSNLDELNARDPRDEPQSISGRSSPYTANPTVDFDGLSWPSMQTLRLCRSQSGKLTVT